MGIAIQLSLFNLYRKNVSLFFLQPLVTFFCFGTVINVYVTSFSMWNNFVTALPQIDYCHRPLFPVCCFLKFKSIVLFSNWFTTLRIGQIIFDMMGNVDYNWPSDGSNWFEQKNSNINAPLSIVSWDNFFPSFLFTNWLTDDAEFTIP